MKLRIKTAVVASGHITSIFFHYIFEGLSSIHTVRHRRRIELEDKAKVDASVWGTKFAQFLAALAILPQSIWKNRMNSTFSFK